MNRIKRNGQGSGRVRSLFSTSLIIGTLQKVSDWIYRKLGSSLVGGLFTSYKALNAKAKSSAVHDIYKQIRLSDRVFTPAKRVAARTVENSVILTFLRETLGSLLSSSMKSYGIFMFSAALYSAIVYVFRIFYFGASEVNASNILTLIVMLISSVLMIASRHTLASALLTSPTASFVLFKIVGIRSEVLEGCAPRKDRFDIPFIAGLIFGIASIALRPLILLSVILIAIGAYLVLIKPEFGVLLIITCLPFAPTMTLVAAVIHTAACFFIKAMRGKRSVKFDLVDAMVLIFLCLMLMGGIVACSSSIRSALVYCAFILAYFLVVNLIRSREWVMRCIFGIIASCTAVSLYGLFEHFFGLAATTWHDTRLFEDISGRVVSTFENPNVLSEYLIMCIPIIFTAMISSKTPKSKIALLSSVVAGVGCLVFTWSRGAWIGFLIGAVLFLLMHNKNTLVALFLGAFAVPFLPLVLPQSIVQRITSIGNMSDGSTIYRVSTWQSVWKIIKDYWQSGIGIGEEAFEKIYRLYATVGIENAPHSHNLYMQILVELGIVGLVAFVALMLVWAQSAFTLHVSERRCEKMYSNAIFCGIVAVLAQGMTDYIWYNYRIFLMFWLLIGLGTAICKTLYATAPEEII